MSRVTTMPGVKQLTCVTGVSELEECYVSSAAEVIWVFIIAFDIDDFAGILAAFLVDQSFVGMFTSQGKSQYVASTFAARLKILTTKEQRFLKGVTSDLVNNKGTLRHYISVNRDLGHSGFHILGGLEGRRAMFYYTALSRD